MSEKTDHEKYLYYPDSKSHDGINVLTLHEFEGIFLSLTIKEKMDTISVLSKPELMYHFIEKTQEAQDWAKKQRKEDLKMMLGNFFGKNTSDVNP